MKKIVLLSLMVLAFCAFPVNAGAQTCDSPSNLNVTDVDERSATLKWTVTDNTATSFDLVVSKEQLTDPTSGNVQNNISATNNDGEWTYTLTSLTSDTYYYVYIRTHCGTDDYSSWISAEFHTMSILNCVNKETIVVANGTKTNGMFPVYGSRCDNTQRTQSIYPASMLTGLLGNQITKLKYFVQSGTSTNWGNATFNIRMMTTTQSTLSGFASTTNATRVYSGTLSANPSSGYMEINLTTPFNYTGGNLLIEFELPTGIKYGDCNFYGIEDSDTVSYITYGSTTVQSTFLPKVEFTTCEKVPFCTADDNFAVAEKTSTSANLTWIRKGGASAWKIHGASNNAIDINSSNCVINGTQVSYKLNGLTPNTPYTLQLQSMAEGCSEDLYSSNLIFRTLNTVTGITSFSLGDDVIVDDVAIDATNHTISAIVKENTDLTTLAFTLTLEDNNGIAKVGNNQFTGSWDFTNPVTIQVYAEDRNISQDWTITIVKDSCYNLNITNIAERSATLNWNLRDNSATAFNLVVSKEQLDPSTIASWQNVTATNNTGACTYPLTSITPDTHYYVYVRTDCGNNEYSRWSSAEFCTKAVLNCGNKDTIVVAEGTETGDGRFPVNGLYCDDTQRTQSIYPASMLTSLLGNKIKKLKYFVSSGGSSGDDGNWENDTFNIKMMTTTQSTLSGFASTTNATSVYRGTLSANTSGGMVIELTTPFNYTGGNLLIEFELLKEAGWSHCYFYGIEASDSVSYINLESSKFLPKVEFTTCEKIPVCPEVTDIAATDIDVNSATITWTASAGEYANTTDFYYSTTPVTDFANIEGNAQLSTDITSISLTDLASHTTYYVYLRTHCDAQGYDEGISGWTGGTSFRTLSSCRVPGTPEATITGKQTATITWTNTSGDAQQADNFTYILSTAPIAEADLESVTTKVSGVNTTSVGFTNLLNGTTYHFYVQNVCTGDVNCSSPWDSCQFTMPLAMPAVIKLQAHDITYNAFTATWECDTANFADETEWEVACVPHDTAPTAWTAVTTPEYVATRLSAETTYDFYVRAIDGTNHSADAMIEVTTLPEGVAYGCKEIIVSENGDEGVVPVYSNYMGSYTIQIYTADKLHELECDGAGYIEKVAFCQMSCVDTSDASKYRKKTTVWVGNTTKGEFDNGQDWIHGLTKVMNEKPINFNKNGDWVELVLDEPFLWDGTSNLAVAVLAYSDGNTSMSFAGGSATSNISIQTCTDENSWSVTDGVPSYTDIVQSSGSLANIRLCFESGPCRHVTKLKVDNRTITTARAHWYPGDNETTWHVYNSTTEMTVAELDSLTSNDYTVVNTNPEYALTDLAIETDYYLYVRAVCGGDDGESAWQGCHYVSSVFCSAPVEAVATSTVDNSITFTVNPGEVGTVGTYDYRYWQVGSENSAVTESGKPSQFTVNSIAGGKYEWEVRANCSGDNGSSRWVKGNTIQVCGTANLPFYSNFNQYEDGSVPDCWNVIGDTDDSNFAKIHTFDSKFLLFSGTSTIATPRLNFPAGDYDVSVFIEHDYSSIDNGK